MNHIQIVIGNIGSGKSTYIKQQVEEGHITGVVISKDSLRYMIGSGNYIFNPRYENAIWKSEMNLIENFMKDKINVVIDGVGVSKKYREKYIELAKKYNYKVVAVVLPRLSKKESVDRRMNNPHQQPDRKLWESVWDKFDRQYQSPVFEEEIDIIYNVDVKEYE